MLNETASTRDDRPAARSSIAPVSREDSQQTELRQMVASVLMIQREAFTQAENEVRDVPELARGSSLVATFEGTLLVDSEAAYNELDSLLAPSYRVPIFREGSARSDSPHIIHIITGRVQTPPSRPWWPNALLFVATLISVLMVGTNLALNQIADQAGKLEAQRLANRWVLEMWRGLPYALSILLILGAHELGHYFAARRHKLAVTLPYFIPLPFISPFGTMGAFIQLRQPMRNRKILFDVGASGPLVGLIFALPILFIGLRQTHLIPVGGGGFYEGDSILYAAAKTITFGHFVPDGSQDVCIDCSQLAWAGWTGLLVTSLNLIPLGQLDGGHVLYSLIGEHARKLYYPLLGVMIALALLTDVWIIWVVLLLIFGRIYATPMDMITPLDSRRRWLAIATLVIFVLIFIPAPLREQAAAPGGLLPTNGNGVSIFPMAMPAMIFMLSRWRR
jgi:Zn-dependent protease